MRFLRVQKEAIFISVESSGLVEYHMRWLSLMLDIWSCPPLVSPLEYYWDSLCHNKITGIKSIICRTIDKHTQYYENVTFEGFLSQTCFDCLDIIITNYWYIQVPLLIWAQSEFLTKIDCSEHRQAYLCWNTTRPFSMGAYLTTLSIQCVREGMFL